jgi:hypothetical protein
MENHDRRILTGLIKESICTAHPCLGGMAEWFKAAVLKTVVRKYRGFESYFLRQNKTLYGEMTE